MSKSPYLDRNELIEQIDRFVNKFSPFFKATADRMSDLYEMASYNEIIRYYKRRKFTLTPQNLKKGVFVFKLSPTGLKENFSYFTATRSLGDKNNTDLIVIEVHHNAKIQSHHDPHLYYSADVSVCLLDGMVSQKQKNGKKHSYIPNEKLITFFEIKNLNPFPEILFSFTGLLVEFMPSLIMNQVEIYEIKDKKHNPKGHLTPGIFFSGTPSSYTATVIKKLKKRYGHNIICGLANNKGAIPTFNGLNEYCNCGMGGDLHNSSDLHDDPNETT